MSGTKRRSLVLRRELEALRYELWHGDFDKSLLARATRLAPRCNRVAVPDELEFLGSLSAIAGAFDYFGRPNQANRIIEVEALKTLRMLPEIQPTGATVARELWKQRIWLLVHYSDCVYWKGDYQQSLELVNQCGRALTRLDGVDTRALALRATLQYARGRAYRQLNELEAATKAFADAIDLTDTRLAGLLKSANLAPVDIALEIQNVQWFVARCLVSGLGWIHAVRGQISSAQHLVRSGLALLRGTKDTIRLTYAVMAEASIRRVSAGRNPSDLAEVIKDLKGAYAMFSEWGHQGYRARAAFELAITYFHAGEPTPALKYIEEVKQTARADHAHMCRALILESRVQSDCNRRVELAEMALDEAEQARETLWLIEALIALGEAECARGWGAVAQGKQPLSIKSFSRAARLLARARGLGVENRKLQAVCYLHLAKAHAGLRQNAAAEEALRRAESIGRHVESAMVHELIKDARAQLGGASFFISAGEREDLIYDDWRRKLQLFLLGQARKSVGHENRAKLAEVLGISRPTLYEWEDNEDRMRTGAGPSKVRRRRYPPKGLRPKTRR